QLSQRSDYIEVEVGLETTLKRGIIKPRVQVLGYNRLLRFLAAGIAVLRAVDPQRTGAVVPELADLADVLDAEALRDGPHNEVFHNPAKTLAARMQQRGVVLAGDSPAAAELAEHGAEVLLQSAGKVATAVDLAEAVAARTRMAEAAGESAPGYDPLFHDEELDGPAPVERIRVFVLSADRDRAAARRRIAVFGGEAASMVDADLVNADVDLLHTEMTDPAAPAQTHAEEAVPANGTELEQLAVLALRLEMAAAYLRLIGSRTAPADSQEQYGGSY
ncbi:tobH protein, partial [Nocardia sp. NPDC019255]